MLAEIVLGGRNLQTSALSVKPWPWEATLSVVPALAIPRSTSSLSGLGITESYLNTHFHTTLRETGTPRQLHMETGSKFDLQEGIWVPQPTEGNVLKHMAMVQNRPPGDRRF